MARIDFLILGYRKLKISPEDLTAVTSLFLRYGIPSQIDSSGNIIVRERDYDKIRGLLQGRIEYTISKPLGLFGRWLGLENKAVYIFSIIASAIIVVLLSSIIWDVRVEGNSKITDSEIVCMLSECGLSIGDFWSSVNRSKVESALLKSQDNLSWVSINRRGVVAYIKVIERNEEKEGNQAKLEYSNIVASRDCIIEEITVSKGIALVKPGDVVKKGDIIILGSLPDEAGGRFCAAEGEVCGRIKEEVKLVVDRKYEKKTDFSKKLYSININFFKISINIFKLYGNLPDGCDIIDDEIKYSLFGKCKLPFSLSINYIPTYEIEEAEYTDDEIVRVASERMTALMTSRLASSDVVRLKTYGEFTAEGYMIRSEYTYIGNVGENAAFFIE